VEKRSDPGRKFLTNNIARSERVRTPESGPGKKTSGTGIPTIERTSVLPRNAGQSVIRITGAGGEKATRRTGSAIANSKPSAMPSEKPGQRTPSSRPRRRVVQLQRVTCGRLKPFWIQALTGLCHGSVDPIAKMDASFLEIFS